MIGVMVCCVPEGLQVTVSSALAINVLKMVKQNVVVKRLSAVQTLGSVTIICTDKTGTITKGEMTVNKLWVVDLAVDVSGLGYKPEGDFMVNGQPLMAEQAKPIEKLLEIAALCNGAKVDPPSDRNRNWSVIGDPTDGALLVSALKSSVNIQDALSQKPIEDILPFSFERKRMSTIHVAKNDIYVYTKGAPRNILDLCTKALIDGKVEELSQENMMVIESRIHEFANQGLRLIAVAYKKVPSTQYKKEEAEQDLVFVGLAAMRDPPRAEVKEAVLKAQQAGVKILIITGDYGPTAEAIAKEVGIGQDCCRHPRVDLMT
jgi:magnesium-transporting ATPase (P-type)